MFRRYLVFLIVVGSAFFSLKAITKDTARVGVLPLAYYTPETKLGLGALVYSFFKTDTSDLKKSNSQTYLSYTLNHQFAIENDYQIWLNSGKSLLIGSVDFLKFPEFFYGLGNNTQNKDKKLISFNKFRFLLKYLKKAGKYSYIGGVSNYEHLYNLDFSMLETTSVIYGEKGYKAAGVGLIFISDKRDNALNPEKGHYHEISSLKYVKINNTYSDFHTIKIDIRNYLTLSKGLVWNSNLYAALSEGNVPFRLLPSLGGGRFLRGYYSGRFRDMNLFLLQHEFRIKLVNRVGLALFNGVGEVVDKVSKFKTKDLHYNYGIGLRFAVNKKDNANLRLDLGFTKDSYGFYVLFAEAF